MSKNSKGIQNQIKMKYSWQFWCLLSVFITIIVFIILLLLLSVKALVQDIQLMYYENIVEGTVSYADFRLKTCEHDNHSSVATKCTYKYVHYIISFSKETAGYNQYEYYAKNMITTEKNVGDRYIVLFNNIENPTLIQREDIITDNIILFLFTALVIIVIILRKKLYVWLIKIFEKFDDFI